jgi:hypothetical protein
VFDLLLRKMDLPAINFSRKNLPLEMKWKNFEPPATPHFFYCRVGTLSRGTQSLSSFELNWPQRKLGWKM